MPTYQYSCTACEQPLEAVQSFSDAALTECPACGGRLRKVYGAVGVVFKGSGFYKTDSRSEAKKATAAASASTESGSSSPSGEKSSGTASAGSGGSSSSGTSEGKGSDKAESKGKGSDKSGSGRASRSAAPTAAPAKSA